MKKFDIKSMLLGFVIGTVGITTVFAANGIKSATFSNAGVTLDGVSVPLDNSLVAIEKDGEKDARLYMPVREIFEYIGFRVEFDNIKNLVKLNSPKHSLYLSESLNEPSNKSTSMDNNIPEHFTSGGIAKTTQNANTYTYEGVIGVDEYQFGNPFSAKKGDQLVFKLNSLECVSGEAMAEDESILRITFSNGKMDENESFFKINSNNSNIENNLVGFNFIPNSIDKISLSMPALKTANNSITIRNLSEKEIEYSFTLTIE